MDEQPTKQLISRIDDDLHKRLKERAEQEGRAPPTLDEVLDINRGSGTAVSDALRAEGHAR